MIQLQQMCYEISTKENGKYYASFEYHGHVNMIMVWVKSRTGEMIFYKQVFLDLEDTTLELIEELKKYM